MHILVARFSLVSSLASLVYFLSFHQQHVVVIIVVFDQYVLGSVDQARVSRCLRAPILTISLLLPITSAPLI